MEYNYFILFLRRQNVLNRIPLDVIITGNQINFNFFNCSVKNDIKVSQPLLFAVIHQPHIFFSLSSTSGSCQVCVKCIIIFMFVCYCYLVFINFILIL